MKKNNGFTLIEVLISMLVLAIGLLGLAALQMTTLRQNLSAYHRTQATQFAYNIADRMRANVDEAKLGANSLYVKKNPASASKQTVCITVASPCNPTQMAEQDLFEWYDRLSKVLPNGVGVIESIDSNQRLFKIKISWTDKNKIKDAFKTSDLVTFEMSFKL